MVTLDSDYLLRHRSRLESAVEDLKMNLFCQDETCSRRAIALNIEPRLWACFEHADAETAPLFLLDA